MTWIGGGISLQSLELQEFQCVFVVLVESPNLCTRFNVQAYNYLFIVYIYNFHFLST